MLLKQLMQLLHFVLNHKTAVLRAIIWRTSNKKCYCEGVKEWQEGKGFEKVL